MSLKLLPHQQDALRWAEYRSRIALFMEMRLGKTIVTMRWAQLHKLQRVLLLAPWNTLVGTHNWQGELQRAGEHVTMLCLMETRDRVAATSWAKIAGGRLYRRPARGWFLIHYEGLRVCPQLLDEPWDAIVVDESTKIRNPKAQITKLLLRRADAEHRAILSGLPNPESPLDFFTQFQFLTGSFMGFDNYWAFRNSKFKQGGASWQWWPKGGVTEEIKTYVRQHAFLLTRAEAKIGSKKIYETRTVPMNPTQLRLAREVAKKWTMGDAEAKHAPVVQAWLQQIAGGFAPGTAKSVVRLVNDAKIRLLHDVVTEEFPRDNVVVWFRFNHEIDEALAFLQARKVSAEAVHGGLNMPKEERARIQERFQSGQTRVLLLQVALGQFGWNLSRADTEIYYSNTYEYESRSQSEDRTIHPTKTTPVTVIDLITINSADEDVVEALRDKKMTARRFTGALASSIAARLARLCQIHPGDDL